MRTKICIQHNMMMKVLAVEYQFQIIQQRIHLHPLVLHLTSWTIGFNFFSQIIHAEQCYTKIKLYICSM